MLQLLNNKSNPALNARKNGYDYPIVGINNGHFYPIHITAMLSILSSLSAGIVVVIVSFTNPTRRRKQFFKWKKCERFAVYIAACDCFFNVSHFLDHFHIAIARDNVRPIELCVFYASTIIEFVTSQWLMLNVVAVNIFFLIFFRRDIGFGKYDWKLLFWMFGLPLIFVVVAVLTESLGPTGYACFFDAKNGGLVEILIITSPLTFIFVTNSVLYMVVWYQIYREERDIKMFFGTRGARVRKSHRAAKRMSLFIIAFSVQWSVLILDGFWKGLGSNPPFVFYYVITILPNIGGVLNGIVYYLIRPKIRRKNDSGMKVLTIKNDIVFNP